MKLERNDLMVGGGKALSSSLSDGIGLAEKFAYAFGATGASMGWNLATGFLVFYYSDVVGLPLSVVGTVMLATRVLDAIFDPVAGIAVDHTRSRWGKARPYLLFTPIAFAVLLGLTFAVPNGGVASKTLYACATFALLGLLYSFFYVPFGALLPIMARSQSDKVTLASLRSIGIATGAIVIYAATLPLVKLFGRGNPAAGFTYVASLTGVICAAAFLIVFLFCRERNTAVPQARAETAVPGRLNWMRNPIWRMEMFLSFSMFVRLGITVSDTAYYAKAVIRNVDVVSYMLPLSAVAPLIAGMAAPIYLKRAGIRWGNVLILLFSSICYLGLPLLHGWLGGYLVVFFLANLSIGINTASLFVIFADACDLQEHRDGTRQEGVLGSTSSFAAKVGMAVGGSVLAFALSIAGYRPQNPTASSYMVDLMFWLAPAIICAGQALLMVNFRSAGEIIRMDPGLSQFAQVKVAPMGGAIRGGPVDASVKTPGDSHFRKATL